ncbi:hypothetical protein SAMN04487905_10149 [Actinopolyspora xinjiangensis]|uniref:PPE family protein n=1 Tax=Actinopolyspora xinjiangensis TaxID=405564 RepID=A0A1H0N9I6_9ACTN|nr:hypothetical protein [Actinopolyspora xinjiangensis]SDO89328.1 hypothetical protein SAMN04487905_10149 [Actinopolyspora xinjiangensis]
MGQDNPLVEEPKPLVSEEDGLALIDFGHDAYAAADRGDWCEAGIDLGAGALDAVLLAADPFSTLLSSAYAWMMEHVSPLPEMLNSIAGNPDVVHANAHTWARISDHLQQASQEMSSVVESDTSGWQGAAAKTYRAMGAGEAALIEGAAISASAVGAAVSGAGTAVQIVRTIVRDLIASAMADLTSKLAQWAAELCLTLGAATPALVADGISLVAKWSTRVAEWLDKIVSSFKKLARIVERVKPALSKVDEAMQPVKNAGRKVQDLAQKPGLHDMSFKEEAVFHTVRNTATITPTNDDQAYAQHVFGNDEHAET